MTAIVERPTGQYVVTEGDRHTLYGPDDRAIHTWTGDDESKASTFDYRGDVTITKKDGGQVVGYLFDRRSGSSLEDSFVRIIPTNEKTKVNVAYSQIAALAFTGRDTAAGKTFEAWVKKYWEKKAAGETNIQIEPEKLD